MLVFENILCLTVHLFLKTLPILSHSNGRRSLALSLFFALSLPSQIVPAAPCIFIHYVTYLVCHNSYGNIQLNEGCQINKKMNAD